MKITAIVLEPTHAIAKKVTQEDVWGEYDHGTSKMIHNGMIVARGKEKCPFFKDTLPYKSVTVVCPKEQESEVSYWLEYVHGGDSISKRKEFPDGYVAIRSNYMCW